MKNSSFQCSPLEVSIYFFSSNCSQYEINNLSVQACDLALHFTSRMVQYILFNALNVEYENIIIFLRNIAKCWKDDKRAGQKILDCINKFKKMVQEFDTFQNIWQVLESVDEAAITPIQKQFMTMLIRNGKQDQH